MVIANNNSTSKGKNFLFMIIIIFVTFGLMEIVSRTVTSMLGVESTLVPDSQYGQYSYLTGFYNPSFKSEEFQDVHLVENSEEPVFLKSTVRTGTDRYGFHLDGNDDSQRDLTKKRKCEYRLFFFGGSTAAGRYLANIDDTIPAKLEDLLQKNFNSQGIDIQVINTGSGGFFSVQEVALFQRIRFALKIDYAIFFNGSNDFAYDWNNTDSMYDVNLHPYQNYLETQINERKFPLIAEIDKALATHLSFYFVAKKLVENPSRFFGRLTSAVVRDSNIDVANEYEFEKLVKRHVERYFFNMDSAIALSKSRDQQLPIAVFFQPTLLPDSVVSEFEKESLERGDKARFYGWHDKYPYYDAKNRFYKIIRNEISNRKAFSESSNRIHDLSRMFDSKTEMDTFYGDHVHYLPSSRSLIAEEIYKKIKMEINKHLSIEFSSCGFPE